MKVLLVGSGLDVSTVAARLKELHASIGDEFLIIGEDEEDAFSDFESSRKEFVISATLLPPMKECHPKYFDELDKIPCPRPYKRRRF